MFTRPRYTANLYCRRSSNKRLLLLTLIKMLTMLIECSFVSCVLYRLFRKRLALGVVRHSKCMPGLSQYRIYDVYNCTTVLLHGQCRDTVDSREQRDASRQTFDDRFQALIIHHAERQRASVQCDLLPDPYQSSV